MEARVSWNLRYHTRRTAGDYWDARGEFDIELSTRERRTAAAYQGEYTTDFHSTHGHPHMAQGLRGFHVQQPASGHTQNVRS